jgi:hypothetical protein
MQTLEYVYCHLRLQNQFLFGGTLQPQYPHQATIPGTGLKTVEQTIYKLSSNSVTYKLDSKQSNKQFTSCQATVSLTQQPKTLPVASWQYTYREHIARKCLYSKRKKPYQYIADTLLFDIELLADLNVNKTYCCPRLVKLL